MLWFICPDPAFRSAAKSFKYILCYGSSAGYKAQQAAGNYLNTSYVMVHLIKSLVIVALGRFKYILCYGSSSMDGFRKDVANDLNTSYVMVHLYDVRKD